MRGVPKETFEPSQKVDLICEVELEYGFGETPLYEVESGPCYLRCCDPLGDTATRVSEATVTAYGSLIEN